VKIYAGRTITEALQAQKHKDRLRIILDAFVITGERMVTKLRAIGWNDLADLHQESIDTAKARWEREVLCHS
jgi:hypothetical protein